MQGRVTLKTRLFSTKRPWRSKHVCSDLITPDVAASYTNIGIVYGNKGDRAAATEMYTKAYHILLTVLGPHHPRTQGLKPFVDE